MPQFIVGQRYISEPEPELGLGVVIGVDGFRVGLDFPATGESRLYASDTPILKRARFRVGERVSTQAGQDFKVEEVDEVDGLLIYAGEGVRAGEDELAGATRFSKPHDRFLNGQADTKEAFDLRVDALRLQSKLRQSETRGFCGGRVDLIPHQFYILKEVSSRQIPRVLLADEVGLGKTIEACLILQRLQAVGRAERILILVPESLVHQWFVELLRRFNMWFSIYDEERCRAVETGSQDGNPFLDEQLALCSISFLANSEIRREQAIAAGWDMVVVDEAHHLEWSPASSSPEYDLVEKLASQSPGLLLLTATPTQLGLEGHFARLRLLDPDRYGSLDAYRKEAEDFGLVASIAGKIADDDSLNAKDRKALQRIFDKDEAGLAKKLADLDAGKRGARKTLLKALLDEHGTGRVVFRNSRSNMANFPKRRYCPAPVMGGDARDMLLARVAKELQAEATDDEASIRYSFKDDPRLAWLASFLKARKDSKALLICKSRQKALAIEAGLQSIINAKTALFHEELPLVQRDRNAAWFAEEEGAQLLICSEIGSEGRNFQFAHHLILFDLPLNPGLLEQRIGRLDRIGQKETIQVHVPFLVGSCQEFIAEWYHQGLDAFEVCAHGGNEYMHEFGDRLLSLALEYGKKSSKSSRDALEAFVEETATYRAALSKKLRLGRDRLLEMNSFDADEAVTIIKKVEKADENRSWRLVLDELFDAYGVRVDEHEAGDVFIDPRHAYVEAFPSIPAEGMLATFERSRAISREDITFVSQDHPIVKDSLDLLLNSEKGTSCFCIIESDTPGLMLEAVFLLETVAASKLHVDRFLSPTPIRVLVDIGGRDLSQEQGIEKIREVSQEASLNRFLERTGFSGEALQAMLGAAELIAGNEAQKAKAQASSGMQSVLGEEMNRLLDLQRINENVTQDEIDAAAQEIEGLQVAIEASRLRLDCFRLIAQEGV